MMRMRDVSLEDAFSSVTSSGRSRCQPGLGFVEHQLAETQTVPDRDVDDAATRLLVRGTPHHRPGR